MKKIVVLIMVIMGFSCSNDDNIIDDEPYSPGECGEALPYFEILGFELTNFEFSNDGYYPLEELNESDAVNWSNYLVKLEFEQSFFSEKSDKKAKNKAIDLSCVGNGFLGDVVGVKSLIVTTKFDYNETYLAGNDISSIIITNSWKYATEKLTEFETIKDYINLNQEGVKESIFNFSLSESPSADKDVVLEFTYVLNNDETFNKTTTSVFVLK